MECHVIFIQFKIKASDGSRWMLAQYGAETTTMESA